MKKIIPMYGDIIDVYDDSKGCLRRVLVTSHPHEDEVLGTMFDIAIILPSSRLKLNRTVYWSVFRKSWSIYELSSGVNVVPADQVVYEEENNE